MPRLQRSNRRRPGMGTMNKRKTVMVTNGSEGAGVLVKKGKGVKESKGARGGKGVKVTKVAEVANSKEESVNKGKVRNGKVPEKSKKNIHPWQRRTMGGSFSGDVLLEYGGEELGEKSGRVAWKDPDDIKQEEQTTQETESEETQKLLQPTKERGRGVKRKPPTKFVAAAQDIDEEADDRQEEDGVGLGAFSQRSVGESTMVNTMELPNFQIDQATSLLEVKQRNWSTKMSHCKNWKL